MTVRSTATLIADLDAVARATFPDRDFPAADPDSRVFADLGLASIDVVVLAEQLEAHFGRSLPFGPFLAELRAAGADDFTLGQLAAYIQPHVGGP